MKHRRAARLGQLPTYSKLHVLLASPTEPMPEASRRHQLTIMYVGLRAIERGESPTRDDWRHLADAVNLTETLLEHGHVADPEGLLGDAVRALARAGSRAMQPGAAIRLDGPGIEAVRSLLACYGQALEQLPHRVMVEAHRATEKRIREIQVGKGRPHDITVVAI